MNKSLDAMSSAVDSATGRVALWMEVGLRTFIFVARCAMIRGSRPRAENAEPSVKAALLGFDKVFGIGLDIGASILGL